MAVSLHQRKHLTCLVRICITFESLKANILMFLSFTFRAMSEKWKKLLEILARGQNATSGSLSQFFLRPSWSERETLWKTDHEYLGFGDRGIKMILTGKGNALKDRAVLTLARTFSKEAGLTREKQIRNTSWGRKMTPLVVTLKETYF